MKQSLIQKVTTQKERISTILVSGDLTSVASPAEFVGCASCVFEIADAIGVERKNILFTFGNHDVDWRICSLATGTSETPEDEHYNIVAAKSGGLFVTNEGCEELGPVAGSGVFRRAGLTIFFVNSGIHCIKAQSFRHGKIGEQQLQWLTAQVARPPDDDAWRVLMVHHHPFKYPFATVVQDISCLEDGAELVELIGKNGIHFICHGHRHEPKLFTEMRSGWRAPVTFFCAGSVAVEPSHRNSGEISNYFHIVSLEHLLPSGAAFGAIRSYEYFSGAGWIPAEMIREFAPLDSIQRFGVVANANELKAATERLLTRVAQISGDRWFPDLHELPLELQCLRLRDLNDLLAEVAFEQKRIIVGKYPERVFMVS